MIVVVVVVVDVVVGDGGDGDGGDDSGGGGGSDDDDSGDGSAEQPGAMCLHGIGSIPSAPRWTNERAHSLFVVGGSDDW